MASLLSKVSSPFQRSAQVPVSKPNTKSLNCEVATFSMSCRVSPSASPPLSRPGWLIVSGALAIPGYEANRRGTQACAWLPPKWDWVDPLKDAKAEIEQIAAGLKSRTQALAERGYDAEQVDAEIAADRARERALELSFGAKTSRPRATRLTEQNRRPCNQPP